MYATTVSIEQSERIVKRKKENNNTRERRNELGAQRSKLIVRKRGENKQLERYIRCREVATLRDKRLVLCRSNLAGILRGAEGSREKEKGGNVCVCEIKEGLVLLHM